MDPRSKAIELVQAADALILDFDGPICDVFAGYPAAQVASELIRQVDFEIQTEDPLDVVRRAVQLGADVEDIDQMLTDLECLAIEKATESPGVRELIRSFDGPIGIASNNAERAIKSWLDSVGLASAVRWVEGRDPRTMKPDPRSLLATIGAINIAIDGCVFVGDSASDLLAARGIGLAFIGLATQSHKAIQFSNQGCDAIVRGMVDLSRTVARGD